MNVYKSVIITLMLALGSAHAQQQSDLQNIPVDLQVDAETSYKNKNGKLRRIKDPNIVEVDEEVVAPPSQGVIILNSQTTAPRKAQRVLQQPTTYVEASPLVDSRAEQLRKRRQAAEISTEQRIVEKLESSRLEDEKERASRLFGGSWKKPEPPQQPVVPVYQANEVPVQTVETVNVDNRSQEDLSTVKDEIIEAVKEVQAERLAIEDLKKQQTDTNKPKDTYYVGGVIGMAEYNADNVESNGAGGFTLGTVMANGVIVEGSFIYSNYYLDQWWNYYDVFKEIDQYNFNMAVKYSVLPGRIKPFAGGTISYTHRTYTDRRYDSSFGSGRPRGFYPNDEEVTSNAVDVGFLLGLDFYVSDNFAIGAEYRYSMNMFSKSDSDFVNRRDYRAPNNSEPLENVDYSLFGISGKFAF